MKNFKTYQQAKRLYHYIQTRSWDDGVLKDQVRRASLSIVLNISEGYGKRTLKDRRRFYQIAMGSLRETQAVLDLVEDVEGLKIADHLGACLYRLIQNPGQFP